MLIIYYATENAVYFPLFYMIFTTLKTNFRPAYDRLFWRIIMVIFTTTAIFLTRQIFYVIESLFPMTDSSFRTYKSIPFYITECIIALLLNYMLF